MPYEPAVLASVCDVRVNWRRTRDGYEAWSVFPDVRGESADRDYAVNFVKGAALHCIGDWRSVPNVRFTVVGVFRSKGGS